MPAELLNPDELVSSEDIARQVSRILVSPTFIKSERMRTLLEYLVEQSLRGTPEKLKEYAIGVGVFKRDVSFDPRMDTTVRTEVRRLRSKLDDYYRSASQDDDVVVELPKGSYRLLFRGRARTAPVQVTVGSDTGPAGRRRYVAAAAAAIIVILIITVGFSWSRRGTARAQPPIRSLVVLPIANLSGDASNNT
jgi:anti-sigma-K factor RskA